MNCMYVVLAVTLTPETGQVAVNKTTNGADRLSDAAFAMVWIATDWNRLMLE